MQAAPPGPRGGRRIGRRPAIACAAALAVPDALAVTAPARADAGGSMPDLPPGDAIAFRILRDGSEVGLHRIAFERRGRTRIARVAIDIAVTYAWITVFRFAHRAEETWQGGRFRGIGSHTDDNGTEAWMRTADDAAGGFHVAGSGTEPYAAPPGALPSTYWNPAVLNAPLISSQDGKLCLQRVVAGEVEQVPCAGAPVLARRYEMHGDIDLEIWYDLQDQWAHMRLRRDGSLITYLRL